LAAQVHDQIVRGADFAELARRYSNAGNAHVGGEFGWLSRGTLTPEVDATALRLAVGETSSPIDGDLCVVLVQRTE
jgi:peptidyl-prolyl cis-trans isomerase SurA